MKELHSLGQYLTHPLIHDANDPRSSESNGREQLFGLYSANYPFGYKVGRTFYWVCRCAVQGGITNKEIYHPQP